jgi:hypothetical protein
MARQKLYGRNRAGYSYQNSDTGKLIEAVVLLIHSLEPKSYVRELDCFTV